ILQAAVECLGRYGIAKTTVDDAAREAGVARATVYRHFPDGKDQVISESITWAVAQFLDALARAGADAPDFPTRMERALVHADWLSRMGLSFVISEGSWDLTDPAAVRRLVREELLVGILR